MEQDNSNMADFWSDFGTPSTSQTTTTPTKSKGFWSDFGDANTKPHANAKPQAPVPSTPDHTGAKQIMQETLHPQQPGFFKELGSTIGQSIGEGAKVLSQATGLSSVAEGFKGTKSPTDFLAKVPEVATKTAGGLISSAAGSVINPALGAVEQATGKRIGTVGAPEFGLNFSSPQEQMRQNQSEGQGQFESGLSILANQAVGAGMLTGAFGEGKGESSAPKEKIIEYSGRKNVYNYLKPDEYGNVYTTSDKEFAKTFGPNIHEVDLTDKKIFDATTSEGNAKLTQLLKGISGKNQLEKMRNSGYDGIRWEYTKSDGTSTTETQLFNKQAVYSTPKPTPEQMQAKTTAPASVTLRSGIDPGVQQFIEQDIKPTVKQVGEIAKEGKGIISPAYSSDESLSAADKVRGAKAAAVNAYDIERAKNADTAKFFSQFKDEENVANIAEYERTGKFKNAPEGYSEYYRKTTDEAHKIISEITKNPVGYIDNYVRRQFKFDTPLDESKAQTYISNKTRTLSGSKSVLRQRTFDIPIDEALNEMRAQGINVQPKFTNPELIRQSTIGNAVELKAYDTLKKSLKKNKLIKFVSGRGKIPEGMVKLDDPAFKVFFPGEDFKVNGNYYANADVAKVLNNAVSRGLEDSKIFRGFRQVSNGLNQYQLGLSGFHATFTAIDSSISDLALGMKQLSEGRFKEGTTSIARSAIPGVSSIRSYIKGDEFLKALKDTNPEAVKVLEDKFNPGGGRLSLDSSYRIKAYENMVNAFKEGNLIGGVARIPGAIIEKVAGPLMQKAIPKVKIGTYLDLVSEVDKRMEGAKPAERARAYAQAWDSIDNRFGQLVYDNLFWNKVTKDLAMVSTRSVGWNLGTIREFGGAALDILKGRGFTDRAAYAVATPIYVGMLGAIYHYLHTGQAPKTLKDYFEPENGVIDKFGNHVRIRLPTYMRDVTGYAQDPLGTLMHKTSPGINIVSELATNRDYYGDLIRNPDDPISKQLEQSGQYVLSQLEPFSIQNLTKTNQEKANLEQKAESFAGVTQAPAKDIQSPEQQKLYKDYRQIYGQFAPRTPEEKQVADLKVQAQDLIRSGGDYRSLLDQIRKAGGFKSRAEETAFIKSARKTIEQKQRSVDKILRFQGK